MAKMYAMKPGWKLLLEHFPEARLLWDAPAGNGHLRAYSIRASVVVVHDYSNGNGWQVYRPVTDDGEIDATLQAISDYTGQTLAAVQ